MIAGVGRGVVVAASPTTGKFAPAAFWPDGSRAAAHLAEAAERALAERRGIVLKRDGGADASAPERERYDVAYPIQAGGRVHGVVALDIAPRPQPELEGVLRQLQWGAGWLEVLVHRLGAARLDPGSVEASKQRLRLVLDLVASALGHDRFHGAATAFATTLATRLGCDLVSLGFHARGRMHVRAVSHTASFVERTNLIRAIGAAMDEALDQRSTVMHPQRGDAELRVTTAHEDLARESELASACTVLLPEGPRFIGALTLQRASDQPFDAATVEFCEVLASVAGPVLELQRRDDRWLAEKLVDTVRRQLQHLVGPWHTGLKLTVGTLALLGILLVTVTGEYRVSSRSVIEASTRMAAVAPFRGYLKAAPVRAGDVVREGQVLAALDDRELRLEQARWESQLEQLGRQRDQARARGDAATLQIATAQANQARAQLALTQDLLSRTQVVAPFVGSVVTGDLSQSLGSPVERGQVLFEVAPLATYRVVLEVDERDIAEVAVGQRGHLLLTAWPSDAVAFTVTKITPVSTSREGRNYFRVEASLGRTPERLRPGMEGVGKIVTGRRLFVWIWARQAIDWTRLKLWAWLP